MGERALTRVPQGLPRCGLQVREGGRLKEKRPCAWGVEGDRATRPIWVPGHRCLNPGESPQNNVRLPVCFFICWNGSAFRGLRLRIPATVLYSGAGRGVSPGRRVKWGNTQLPLRGLFLQGCGSLGARGFVTGKGAVRSLSPAGRATAAWP